MGSEPKRSTNRKGNNVEPKGSEANELNVSVVTEEQDTIKLHLSDLSDYDDEEAKAKAAQEEAKAKAAQEEAKAKAEQEEAKGMEEQAEAKGEQAERQQESDATASDAGSSNAHADMYQAPVIDLTDDLEEEGNEATAEGPVGAPGYTPKPGNCYGFNRTLTRETPRKSKRKIKFPKKN